MESREIGQLGERMAARFLREAGFELLFANYHSRFGEIDLIVQDKDYLAFIEVKTRSGQDTMTPREAVDYHKQQRLIKTAKHFLLTHDYDLQPRFDVVEVLLTKDDQMQGIEHYKNAFTLD